MSIKFACESCGKTIKLSENFVGTRGRCPHCHLTINIPAAGQAGAAPSRPVQAPSPPPPERRPPPRPQAPPLPPQRPARRPPEESLPPLPPPPQPERVKLGDDMGQFVGEAKTKQGCFGPKVFAGVMYLGRHYYVSGAGGHQPHLLQAIQGLIRGRTPEKVRLTPTQVTVGLHAQARDMLAVRWNAAYGYIVCFAPGDDLFISVRVHFLPGCLKRLVATVFRVAPDPDPFDLDDISMVSFCLFQSVEQQLDGMQLAYLSGAFGAAEE